MRKTTMFLAGLAIAAPALAVTVPATGEVGLALPGTTSSADPTLATTNVSDTVVNFSTPAGVTPAISGKLQIRIAKSVTTGKRIYSWRVINNANSGGKINAFQVVGFPAASYDANWRSDSIGTISPVTLAGTTSTKSGSPVRILAFQFGTDGLAPGKESKFFFLKAGNLGEDSMKATGRVKTLSGNIDMPIPRPLVTIQLPGPLPTFKPK